MSNILNKSNHPVHVSRISIKIWRLRDEIEKVISIRMKDCTTKGIELDISDIQQFYTKKDLPDTIEESDDNLDSSGNEMDEDALAMMAAMGGGGDEASTDEDSENSSEEESEDDAEAAKLAEMMMADQMSEDEVDEQSDQKKEDKQQSQFQTLERTIPDDDKVSVGFAFLSDMDMGQMLSFSKNGFTIGQNICIQFLIPNSFIMTGEVIGSNHVGRNSRIISQMRPDFRIMTSFSFLFSGERAELRNFLKSVEPDIPVPPKKLKKADGEDDDEFEDLGF